MACVSRAFIQCWAALGLVMPESPLCHRGTWCAWFIKRRLMAPTSAVKCTAPSESPHACECVCVLNTVLLLFRLLCFAANTMCCRCTNTAGAQPTMGERVMQSVPGTDQYEATHGMTGAHRAVEQGKAYIPGAAEGWGLRAGEKERGRPGEESVGTMMPCTPPLYGDCWTLQDTVCVAA